MDSMRTVVAAKDVTEQDLAAAVDITDGWYPDRIEWDNVWERMESWDRFLDLGTEIDSPAMRKIKAYVRKVRREG